MSLGCSTGAKQPDLGHAHEYVNLADQGSALMNYAPMLHSFIFLDLTVKMQMPDGWVDGADRYPVYSVSPSSTLSYTMQKLIASQLHASQVLHMYDADRSLAVLPLHSEYTSGFRHR